MAARHQRPCSPLVQFLRENAPPAPKCFRSQEDWVSWLHQAEVSGDVKVIKLQGRTGKGEANRGRIKTQEINKDIDFCQDCTAQRQRQMLALKKCEPPMCAIPPLKQLEAA